VALQQLVTSQFQRNSLNGTKKIHLKIFIAPRIASCDFSCDVRPVVVAQWLTSGCAIEVVSWRPAQIGHVKPKTLKQVVIVPLLEPEFGSDNLGSFGYDLTDRGPVSQQVWHVILYNPQRKRL
jgi:hypothetical protein